MSEQTCTQASLLGPWRRNFQWLVSLTILLLPWFQVNGNSLLRVDIGSLSLHLFGQRLRIEELYLLLFFSLCLALLFLLVTLVMGRVWCGWACPQTTLTDLAEWFSQRIGLKTVHNRLAGPLWRRVTAHLFFGLLSLTVGANLVWYFVEPQRFFASIASGALHPGAWASLLIVAVPVYLDLALLRRLICSDFCPYGRFQSALVDPGTLTLLLPEDEQGRCIECGECIRCCPMGIDIRQGYQVECINCGRCLDACRLVMADSAQDGLIHYRFGVEGRGVKALLNPRTLLLSGSLLVLTLVMVISIFQRADASLKVAASHTAASRLLSDGRQVTFFSAWINNRTQDDKSFVLHALSESNGPSLEIKGQAHNLELAGGQNRKVEFALVSPRLDKSIEIALVLRDSTGKDYARAEATLLPITQGTDHEP